MKIGLLSFGKHVSNSISHLKNNTSTIIIPNTFKKIKNLENDLCYYRFPICLLRIYKLYMPICIKYTYVNLCFPKGEFRSLQLASRNLGSSYESRGSGGDLMTGSSQAATSAESRVNLPVNLPAGI